MKRFIPDFHHRQIRDLRECIVSFTWIIKNGDSYLIHHTFKSKVDENTDRNNMTGWMMEQELE